MFDLSKSVTILYGNNGNGKSSFFDAIEWSMTGEISRFNLAKRSGYREIVANQNISFGDLCSVELFFGEYSLKRYFSVLENGACGNVLVSLSNENDSKKVTGEDNVRKKLAEIVGQGHQESNSKWDNSILSKAYILSQDQVTDFIAKDSPKERYDSLASIMGFEKINTLRNNILKATAVLSNEIKENVINIKSYDKKLKNESGRINKEIAKLGIDMEHIQKSTDVSILSSRLTKLNSDLAIYKKESNLIVEHLADLKIDRNEKLELFKNNLLKEISELEFKEKEINILTSNLKAEIDDLTKLKIELISEKEVLNKNQQIKTKLENYINELKSEKIEYTNDVNQSLKKRHRNLDRQKMILNYAVSNIEEYNSQLKVVSNKEIVLSAYSSELEKLDEEREDLNGKLNLIVSDFSHGEVLENIKELLSVVQVTKKIVDKEKVFNDKCPVCNSNVPKLNNVLDQNIASIVSKSGEYQEIIQKSLEKRKTIEESLDEVEKKRKKCQETKVKTEKNIVNSEEKLSDIVNVNLFDIDLFKLSKKELEIKQRTVLNDIEKLDTCINLISSIEKLSSKLVELEDLKSAKYNLKDIEKNIMNLVRTKENLSAKNIKNVEELGNLRKKSIEFQNRYKYYKNVFNKYKVSSLSDVKNHLSKEIQELNKEVKNIEKAITNIVEIKELQTQHNYIIKIKEAREDAQRNNLIVTEKKQELDTIIEKINNQYGDKASTFLNSKDSPIKRYYSYLNPNLVSFGELDFCIKENKELDIKVQGNSENKNAYANYLLSSGQLNVLAIAIFIATNTAQTFSYFNFIAIDDPIQNMDDINKFSITDVLSDLKQQLIFSTHDLDYVKLFIKKNEYRLNEISLYSLDSERNKYENIIEHSLLSKKQININTSLL